MVTQNARRGRGASAVRTPSLIRDYLGGTVAFPGDEPGEAAVRAAAGDFIARMHQRIKSRIFEIDPQYQYPRKHSFLSLVYALVRLGLVERTGRREDPRERGAGMVGVAGGFEQRTWVRLTPGSAQRPEWADPMGYLALIYPGIRPAGGVLPTRVAPPTRGRRPRRPVPEGPSPEGVDALNARRQALMAAAQAAQSSEDLETFQELARSLGDFLGEVAREFPRPQFPDAAEALALLRNCITLLENAMMSGRGITVALGNCQASARLAAEGLTTPLVGGPPTETAPMDPRELPAVPGITLPQRFTIISAPRLAAHLEELVRIADDFAWPDERFPALAAEVQGLLERGREWLAAAQEALDTEEGKESPGQARLQALEERVDLLQQLVDALDEQDLPGALESLNQLA